LFWWNILLVTVAEAVSSMVRALGWNCQGMGRNLSSEKMTHLSWMIYSAKPQVIFVS
jgi:hypothetical protein